MTQDGILGRLTSAIADGEAIDWEHEIAAAPPDFRPLIASLRDVLLLSGADEDVLQGGTRLPVVTEVTTWGPLRVLERVGGGTYGTVYRARDPVLDRDVALKLLDAPGVSGSDFVREARLLARVKHPHVVDVYGAGTYDGRPGLWMEFLRGRTFHEIVEEAGPLGPQEACLVGLDVCSALGAMHAVGLLHCDVSARNVMRAAGGRTVLLDFGSGRHQQVTAEGHRFVGTPAYVAPELLVDQPSVSADIYATGVLLFYLTTGEYPVLADDLEELRRAHERGVVRQLRDVRHDVPLPFAAVVHRALMPSPAQRYASAAEMARALGAVLALSVAHSEDEPVAVTPRRRGWSMPRWLALVIALIAGAAAFVGGRATAPAPLVTLERALGRLTDEQSTLLAGYLDLAGDEAERGQWSEAAALYERASNLLIGAVGPDEPIRSVVLAQWAWALAEQGRPDKALRLLDLAHYKLAQEAGSLHPFRVTVELARAQTLLIAGRRGDADEALRRAVAQHTEGLSALGITAGHRFPPAPLVEDTVSRIDTDDDQDWVLDVFEPAMGLDPRRQDTDGDGVPDGEEDADGDGVANAVALPGAADPRKSLGHFGAVDPERVGFRREREFTGTAAPSGSPIGASWRVRSAPMGFYYLKLTRAQKRAAFSRGFRLRARMSLWEGNGFVNLDLVPLSARFDLNWFVTPGRRASLLLMQRSMPREGEWLHYGNPGPLPLIEFVFDPVSQTARCLVDGRVVRTGYGGYRQYQEDFGLFWGTTNDVGAAQRGSADFALAWLAIR